MIHILKIPIDGHFHGSPDVPKPWVAKILGPDPKYGLQREFLQTMNDWKYASRAWSGNIYGRVAHFSLREGELYEVSRLRGNSSRRHVAREFVAVVSGELVALAPEEALLCAIGGGKRVSFRIDEDRYGTSWVAAVKGIGTPERQGFVVIDDRRLYHLCPGLYEVMESGAADFALVDRSGIKRIAQKEALEWLAKSAA